MLSLSPSAARAPLHLSYTPTLQMDRDLAASHGSILCIIPPIALGGGGEGGPCLYMNISEPSVVRQVLLDKVTFPTRGRSGLSDRGVAQVRP